MGRVADDDQKREKKNAFLQQTACARGMDVSCSLLFSISGPLLRKCTCATFNFAVIKGTKYSGYARLSQIVVNTSNHRPETCALKRCTCRKKKKKTQAAALCIRGLKKRRGGRSTKESKAVTQRKYLSSDWRAVKGDAGRMGSLEKIAPLGGARTKGEWSGLDSLTHSSSVLQLTLKEQVCRFCSFCWLQRVSTVMIFGKFAPYRCCCRLDSAYPPIAAHLTSIPPDFLTRGN